MVINPINKNSNGRKNAAVFEPDNKQKRIGVCLECGYTWIGRTPHHPRPPRCSECGNKTNTAWLDELTPEDGERIASKIHGVVENVTSHENKASSDNNSTIKPKQSKNREETEANPAEPPLIILGDDEAQVISPDAATAIAKVAGNPTPMGIKQDYAEEIGIRHNPPKIYLPKLESSVPLIPKPEPAIDEETGEEKPYSFVAWENDDGEIEIGAIVTPEKADRLTEEDYDSEVDFSSADEGSENLQYDEFFDDDAIESEDDEENEEEPEEEVDKKPSDEKGFNVSPTAAILTIGVFAGIGYLLYKITTVKENTEEESNEEPNPEVMNKKNNEANIYNNTAFSMLVNRGIGSQVLKTNNKTSGLLQSI